MLTVEERAIFEAGARAAFENVRAESAEEERQHIASVFACVRRAEEFLRRPGVIEREFAVKVVKP